MDPLLHILANDGQDSAVGKNQRIIKSVPGSTEPHVSTIVRFKEDLSAVEALGGRVRSVIGDIATVDIPFSAVSNISDFPNISYVEADKKVLPHLNVSVPATGANSLRTGSAPNWTGNTGRNVVIGIIDSGIDLSHPDFKDTSGKTRVLYLWDQTVIGTAPTGFNYGNECTKSMIEAGSCSETPENGHGTHVAGIAAGNGSATGNGQLAYRYIGMAPEADLIIVKTSFFNSAVLDGVAYIQAKAKLLGKPSVINLSLGSNIDPHDGTSLYAQALDNASGAGKLIVVSAGNSGQGKDHASGNVAQAGTSTVGFNVKSTSALLDFWYSGSDQMGVSVSNGSCSTPIVNQGTASYLYVSYVTQCGMIGISSSGPNPNNSDREILVDLESSQTSPLSTGSWTLTLIGTSIINGRFDGWSDNQYTTNFTTNVDPTITLGNGATAAKVIAVGSYVTKTIWQGLAGSGSDLQGTFQTISFFSSLGPLRTCNNSALCPPAQKPEITAPGEEIMSSYALGTSTTICFDNASNCLDPDGLHVIDQGTSMAAPHVAGAVALLLQAAPSLTSDYVKTTLEQYANVDLHTGAVPNNTWGFGKLNVQTAFAMIPNPPPLTPSSLSASAGNGTITLKWTANTEMDLDGYYLYRSSIPGSGYMRIASILYKNTSYNDTGLTNGRTYYYVLSAFDTAGHESSYSTQVSATPEVSSTSGAGGGGGCVLNTRADIDPMLWLIFLMGFLYPLWRKQKKCF